MITCFHIDGFCNIKAWIFNVYRLFLDYPSKSESVRFDYRACLIWVNTGVYRCINVLLHEKNYSCIKQFVGNHDLHLP